MIVSIPNKESVCQTVGGRDADAQRLLPGCAREAEPASPILLLGFPHLPRGASSTSILTSPLLSLLTNPRPHQGRQVGRPCGSELGESGV